MADFLNTVFGVIQKRYKDMGDGTHAEVVALGAGSEVDLGERPESMPVVGGVATVPADTVVQPLHVLVVWTSDATVGNRQLILEAMDGTDVIAEVVAQATQAASLTYRYSFALGVASDFAAVATRLNVSLPVWLLEAGQTLRVRDLNDVAAGDTVTMTVMAASKAV